MVDTERKTRRRHCHQQHQRDTSLHTQSPLFFCVRPGVDDQLQGSAAYKQSAASLSKSISHPRKTSYCHGKERVLPGGARKTMEPASPLLPLAASDSPDHNLQETPKTKIVVRGLPPSLSEKEFKDSIDSRFGGFLKWVSFCPGKVSTRKIRNSHAYIDFIHSEDVFKFYEQFNGHVFVSEKGARYKALIYYALHQRVPAHSPVKDKEEGSILADPEYSEFVSGLSKSPELLPSAEVQLERREAEKRLRPETGIAKDSILVTPLMQHVRDVRALKAQKVSVTSRKQISGQGSLGALNLMESPKGAPEISSENFKCPPKVAKPPEKLTYVPRPLHRVSECKSVSDAKRKAALEGKGGAVTRERSLAKSRHEEQRNDKHVGAMKHRASQHMRQECRPQHADLGRKSKHMSGFQGPEKQVWVAKSASRT